MSNEELIHWLEVLGNGYVKPDLSKTATNNTTGVVRETKNYFPFIMRINEELCKRAHINCPDVSKFANFKD